MAITLWRNRRPFDGLMKFWDDMDSWFDMDFPKISIPGVWSLAVDIGEKEGSYINYESSTSINKWHLKSKDILVSKGDKHENK